VSAGPTSVVASMGPSAPASVGDEEEPPLQAASRRQPQIVRRSRVRIARKGSRKRTRISVGCSVAWTALFTLRVR